MSISSNFLFKLHRETEYHGTSSAFRTAYRGRQLTMAEVIRRRLIMHRPDSIE